MEMTADKALEFLRAHQPLPADTNVSRDQLDELDAVRRFLMEHPTDDAVPLLLGVFGDGSGFGVYQLIDDAVSVHDSTVVIPALVDKLRVGPRSVRYWNAVISANHPDVRLIPGLAAALTPEDDDLRCAAVTGLEAIGTEETREILRTWLPNEMNEELRGAIEEILGD
jgi:hypothetical protein